MAYKITDFDGTTVAPSGAYPWGNVKDAPSGTRANVKMFTDMLQFFQLAAAQTGVTLNSTADNATNGYQLAQSVTNVINNYAAQIIINQLGAAYSASTVYILNGCETVFLDGYVFYNGKIYYADTNITVLCGGGLVPVFTISSPITYMNGVQVMSLSCRTSGSGVADYDNAVRFSEWVDTGGATILPVGGSYTYTGSDIKYSKYTIVGKTVTYQIAVQEATVSGSPAALIIQLPWLPTAPVLPVGHNFVVGHSSSDGILIGAVSVTKELTLNKADGTPFTSGTSDRDIFASITFEIA